jgi:cysteine desulfurase
VDVDSLNVDLMSFSAHKFYGPKGVGGLYIRRRPRSTRLFAQIVGGGQQHNLRSGTLNAPGIIGMAAALRVSLDRLTQDHVHAQQLRDQLWTGLQHAIPEIQLNGPSLSDSEQRLVANLNCAFPGVEGQSLMLAVPELCVSSGSACTSAEPHPSHVLLSLGLDEGRVRSSLRFGIGRFNSPGEIDLAVQLLAQGYRKLVGLG